jgi:hypothetical protein
MQPKELSRPGQLVLVALSRFIVQADGELSEEEAAAAQGIHDALGPKVFAGLADYARNRIASLDDLIPFMEPVKDSREREAIHALLTDLAASDNPTPEEIDILNWVASHWID